MENTTALSDTHYDLIQQDVIALVESSRKTAACQINSLTAIYWEIGRRIVETEQQGADRATYGEALIQRLTTDLTARLGRGFSTTNLKPMRSFHLAWPDGRTGQTVSDPFRMSSSSLSSRIHATCRDHAYFRSSLPCQTRSTFTTPAASSTL